MTPEPWTNDLEASRFSVAKILKLARDGVFRLPVFQRSLRWQREENLLLLDSLYRGFPVGTLLLWKHEAPGALLHFGGFSVQAEPRQDALWIVDGQQRLTALLGCLLRTQSESVRSSSDFAFCFDLEKDAFVAASVPAESYQIPVNKLADPVLTSVWASERGWNQDLHRRAQEVGTKIQGYEIPAYISQAQDPTVLRTVFERTNSAGRRMRDTEIFEALNRGLGAATEPTGLLDRLQAHLYSAQFGRLQRAQTLQKALVCVAGFNPKENLPAQLRAPGAALEWESRCAAALTRTVEFLRDDAQIPHASVLPYDLPIIGLARFFHLYPEPCDRSIELLVRWVWRGIAGQSHMVTNQQLNPLYQALRAGEEELVVQRLIALAPRQPVSRPTSSGHFNLRGASTRLGLGVLLQRQPIDPRDGAQLSPSRIFETTVSDLTPSLFKELDPSPELAPLGTLPNLDAELKSSLAARFLVPSLSPTLFAQALRCASEDCLRSHLIPQEVWPRVRSEEWSAVVRARGQAIEDAVSIAIHTHARWGIDDDGPSIDGGLSDAHWDQAS